MTPGRWRKTPLTQLAEQALVSVASRFLETLPECDKDTRENIAYHMAFAHEEVAAASLRCVRVVLLHLCPQG